MLKTSETKTVLAKMLADAGFDMNKPDPHLGWEIFKKFSELKVDCDDDALLFETGVYDFTGEPLFSLGFTRQFIQEEPEDPDNDEGIEQLHFTLYLKPNAELQDLHTHLWTYDCASWEEFFKRVETLKEFKIPMENYSEFTCKLEQWFV